MGMTRQYLEQLSESIGPRPVASDTEREAAEWIREQFAGHGLNTTMQDFDTIRSLSGAFAIYALVPVACVVLLGLTQKWAVLSWLLWALILIVAVLAWLDFSGRGSLSGAFPKGPSQNVIGRYVPLARPGEEVTKIVLVAHYDTARATPLSSEAIAAAGRVILRLAHAIIMLLPLLSLVLVLEKPVKFLAKLQPWSWYALMIICIPVLLMFLDILLGAIVRRYSPGANNNASGVAALLSICEDLADATNPTSGTGASEGSGKFGTGTLNISGLSTAAGMQSPETQSAGLLGEDTGFDTTFDFGAPSAQASAAAGATGSLRPVRGGSERRSSGPAAPAPDRFQDSETAELESLPASGSGPSAAVGGRAASDTYGAYDDYDARSTFADSQGAGPGAGEGGDFEEVTGTLGADVIAGAPEQQLTSSFEAVSTDEDVPDYGASPDDFAAFAAGAGTGAVGTPGIPDISELGSRSDRKKKKKKEKGGRHGRSKKKKGSEEVGEDDQPAAWLGLDKDYNAREEGRKIGSWDNFPNDDVPNTDDFDDGFSWKGGAAEGDLIEDEEYAATQAARIRRKISETLSAGLANKELWFVATSAHYVHSRGMRTFLDEYHEELRGALIINLAALGSGDLYWSINEQAGKTYKSSARLTALARRTAREKNVRAKPYRKGKLQTEAGWALAKGRKAMSVMRLTAAGTPFAQASTQDVVRRLSSEDIDAAVDFVTALIEEL